MGEDREGCATGKLSACHGSLMSGDVAYCCGTPMTDPRSKRRELRVPVFNDGVHQGDETLAVTPLSAERYLLLASPGFVEGLAAGDEFELDASVSGGVRVLRRGGNLCVWFYHIPRRARRDAEARRTARGRGADSGWMPTPVTSLEVVDGKGRSASADLLDRQSSCSPPRLRDPPRHPRETPAQRCVRKEYRFLDSLRSLGITVGAALARNDSASHPRSSPPAHPRALDTPSAPSPLPRQRGSRRSSTPRGRSRRDGCGGPSRPASRDDRS